MDVRYPNGAQCTFGGPGASFIELCVAASYPRTSRVPSGMDRILMEATESSRHWTASAYGAVVLRATKSIAILITIALGARLLSRVNTTFPSLE
jgi:hypothetical protein